MYIFALLGLLLLGGEFRFVKTDAPRSNFDRCVALCCTVLHCGAVCSAVWCGVVQCVEGREAGCVVVCAAVIYSVLQRVAACVAVCVAVCAAVYWSN